MAHHVPEQMLLLPRYSHAEMVVSCSACSTAGPPRSIWLPENREEKSTVNRANASSPRNGLPVVFLPRNIGRDRRGNVGRTLCPDANKPVGQHPLPSVAQVAHAGTWLQASYLASCATVLRLCFARIGGSRASACRGAPSCEHRQVFCPEMNDDSVRGDEHKTSTAQENRSVVGISSDANALHPKVPTDTARDLTLRVPEGKDDGDSSLNSRFCDYFL